MALISGRTRPALMFAFFDCIRKEGKDPAGAEDFGVSPKRPEALAGIAVVARAYACKPLNRRVAGPL